MRLEAEWLMKQFSCPCSYILARGIGCGSSSCLSRTLHPLLGFCIAIVQGCMQCRPLAGGSVELVVVVVAVVCV